MRKRKIRRRKFNYFQIETVYTEEDLLLEEYKLLNNLIIEESNNLWNRFNVFFVLSTFLFSAGAYLLKTEEQGIGDILFNIIIFFICFIGILSTIVWLIILERSKVAKKYWLERSRIIESDFKEKYSLDSIKTFSQYYQIFTKHNYIIKSKKNEEENKEFKLKFLQRRSISNYISYIPALFLAFWSSILVYLISLVININSKNANCITITFIIITPLIVIITLIFLIHPKIKIRKRKTKK